MEKLIDWEKQTELDVAFLEQHADQCQTADELVKVLENHISDTVWNEKEMVFM